MAAPPKRNPISLVTDARDQQRNNPRQSRPSDLVRRPPSRLITVDNVLQYASDIPSMQQRGPPSGGRLPSQRPAVRRSQSGRPAAPRLAGRALPSGMPARSTKVSEKLVLLPEQEAGLPDDEAEEANDYAEDNEAAPERDDEAARRRGGQRKGKSYAERLPKARRTKELARCTAYCTAQAYTLKAMATFLRDVHGARTKLYDDCLYVVYHLPLLPGTNGYRIRSSPVLKSPGGKATVDEEIERTENLEYAEGYFEDPDDAETFSVRGDGEYQSPGEQDGHGRRSSSQTQKDAAPRTLSPPRTGGPDARSFAELYIYSYGVAVFWNFSAHQEKDVLADLTFYTSPTSPGFAAKEIADLPPQPFSPFAPVAPELPDPDSAEAMPLVINPLPEAEIETEEFHFEYDPAAPRPRVFNDMITLRSGDHMVKLTMAHAIAQSTKLSLFEARMAAQMAAASPIPKRLALTGALGLARRDVLRILGALYRTRVEVNLSEPVLDTPQFFWQSEPTLFPLYDALRTYLEISPRVKVLNERCGVFLDLAAMLSESVAESKMSNITWIIIILIAVSIAITTTEVFLRFGLLHSGGQEGAGGGGHGQLEGGGVNGSGRRLAIEGGPRYGVIEGGRCLCPVADVGLASSAADAMKMPEIGMERIASGELV